MAAMETSRLLATYSTCDISDALLKLSCPGGGLLPNISLFSPERQSGDTKVVGPAYPVKFVRNTQTDAPSLEKHYIDTVPSGSVTVISAPPDIPNAVYGGLMSHRARYLGAKGTVIDGNFRDLDEQRRIGFPVFAKGVTTPAYYEVARPAEVNVPVRIHDDRLDIWVSPGDWLVGDLNGVVCIPQALLAKVLEMMPAQIEAEELIMKDLADGLSFAESSRTRRNKRS